MKEYIAKTYFGLESVLAKELKAIGASEVTELNRAVSFKGDQKLMFKANLYLRTAIRILQPIHTFKTKDSTSLYRKVGEIDWFDYLEVNETFAVDSVVNSQHFSHSGYVALRVKDAIVDQFMEEMDKRPNVDTHRPKLRVHIHISNDDATLLLDTSGEPLYKRGYRVKGNIAPVNEILAAGMVQLSGWQGDTDFLDPMCGSGTILIEAAMFALNIPAGIYRKEFAFERWQNIDLTDWYQMLNDEEAKMEKLPELPIKIIGSDIDKEAVLLTKQNIKQAELTNFIQVLNKKIESFVPLSDSGVIITNPPYDERMKKANIGEFYSVIGTRLKHYFNGYSAWILSNNFDAIKRIGLHPAKKMTLYNGSLECKFLNYELYSGSKKQK